VNILGRNFWLDYCEQDSNENRKKEIYSIFSSVYDCKETKELYSKDQLFEMIKELSGRLC
jgi:hypothetical protein